MIERIYIDNFRSFSNFEIKFGNLNVLLGPNGAGKTTLFDVARYVRALIGGEKGILEVFTPETLTRWDSRSLQRIEIDFDLTGEKFQYLLEIEHDDDRSKCRIARESLLFSEGGQSVQPLYRAEAGRAQLFRDNESQGPEVLVDWHRSGLTFIQPRKDNTILTRFKEALRTIWMAAPDPAQMCAAAKAEIDVPSYRFSDFSCWFRCMSQERPADTWNLTKTLQDEVLPGFNSFRLSRVSEEERRLELLFDVNGSNKPIPFSFDEMSDGQKILIALYAMHQFALQGGNTFFLDQPENFLALPEIQPWLSKVVEAADDGNCQVILITHHPELIDLLASESGYWLDRENAGPTRVAKISTNSEGGLPISELIARGWLNA